MADLLSYYKQIGIQNVIFAYKGEIDTQLLRNIIQAADQKMESFGDNLGFRKRVSSILIECLQNTIRHGVNDFAKFGDIYPVVVISRYDGDYLIATGNIVHERDFEFLDAHLKKVNQLGVEGLKVFYQETLQNGKISTKGGAGLGIIDIARKAKDNKIAYNFQKIDEDHLFFSMFIEIQQPVRK